MQNSSHGEQRRDRPPQHKSHFDGELGNVEIAAYPGKTAPDQRCAEDSDEPTEACNHPKQKVAGRSLRRFLSAQTNSELRARSKIARYEDRDVAKRMQEFVRGSGLASAIGALAKVLVEPGLVCRSESFDQRLRKEFLRADVTVIGHAAPSGKADFNAARPR